MMKTTREPLHADRDGASYRWRAVHDVDEVEHPIDVIETRSIRNRRTKDVVDATHALSGPAQHTGDGVYRYHLLPLDWRHAIHVTQRIRRAAAIDAVV